MPQVNSRIPSIIYLTILLLVACNSNQKGEKKISVDAVLKSTDSSTMNELYRKEMRNQENAIFGDKNPQIEVITSKTAVDQMRKEILEGINESKKEQARQAKNKTLSQRYKENDKSVVPELLQILRGANTEKRLAVYRGLGKSFDDPDFYSITEPALAEQLLKGIDRAEDEEDAVQLAARTKLPGFEKAFERRLVSGKSIDEGRLFYWLASRGRGKQLLSYVESSIKSKRPNEKILKNTIDGLKLTAEKGEVATKQKVGDIAIFIYQNKMIEPDRFEELKESAYASEAPETLLQCVFEYGDQRAIPIANDIMQRKIRIVGPMKALVRLEGSKHMDKIHAYLKDEETFHTGMDIIESIDKKWRTEELLKEALVQFALHKKIEDYEVSRMISSYKSMGAESYIKNINSIISNKDLTKKFINAYELANISTNVILSDLVRLKLIDKKPNDGAIARTSKEADGSPYGFVFGILEQQNVYFNFDAETGEVPVGYDSLIEQFINKSKGRLKNIIVWMDAKEDQSGERFQYTIKVISNNKAFVTRPPDVGDWYDIQTVNVLLDKILEDLKSPERFNFLNTGDQTVQYIFGIPGNVKELDRKYKLSAN